MNGREEEGRRAEGNLVRGRGPGPGFEERRNGESTTQREVPSLRVKARSKLSTSLLSFSLSLSFFLSILNPRKDLRYCGLIRDQGRLPCGIPLPVRLVQVVEPDKRERPRSIFFMVLLILFFGIDSKEE